MSVSFDSVTGLPLLSGGADYIDQIPLSVQNVPWDDLKALTRSPRAAIYPDDGYSVYAVLVGQNQNNPDAMQTVYTDGNHNIRVNQAAGGGGSGGGGPLKVSSITASIGVPGPNFMATDNLSGLSINGSSILLGYHLEIDEDVAFTDASGEGTTSVWLKGNTSNKLLYLVTWNYNWPSLTSSEKKILRVDRSCAPGWDMSGTFTAGESLSIHIQYSAAQGSFSYTLQWQT